ncbi:cation diffusion facilitator family transporter [Pseudonocardia sp.]|uniref:cation diffusion facilitator family transporter n=1 Tax=Pseudonocardia sp. TaxID=60912 RepID=UPI003D0A0EFF
MSRRTRSPDDRALWVSMWVSAGFAAVSLVWGLAVGSSAIVFDGLYSCASVVLTLGAVVALRTARRGADDRYPWGREAWEPVTVVMKAAALAALCVYALVEAIGVLLRGGREIATGWALLYAVLATTGGVVVSIYLRRRAREGSDILRAESAEWTGDTLLSFGVLAGFALAFVLQRTGRDDLARLVDPAMVAIICAIYLWVPLRMVRGGFREVLAMAPDPAVLDPLRAQVAAVAAEYGFAETFLRASKVGGRLDVEVDFVVAEDSRARDVTAFDGVREQLWERLTPLGHRLSMSVGFTADRRWVA